jgi:hypothetical protein
MGDWYWVNNKEFKEAYRIVGDKDYNMVIVDHYKQETEEEHPKLVKEDFSVSRSKFGRKLNLDEWGDFRMVIEL